MPVRLRRPDHEMLAGLAAIAVTMGLLICGLQDAVEHERSGWQGIFLGLIGQGLVWYTQLTVEWVRWNR